MPLKGRYYKNKNATTGQRAMASLFRQNMTITSLSSLAEQLKSISFQKTAVKKKQLKVLLEEFPEHFIVNEGKDSKKFRSDESAIPREQPVTNVFVAWPSLALTFTELATNTPHSRNSLVGKPNVSQRLLHGILLATARFNNQTKTDTVFDHACGLNSMTQERFVTTDLDIDLSLIFMLLRRTFSDRFDVLYQYRHMFASWTWTKRMENCRTTDPKYYLYDHVSPLSTDAFHETIRDQDPRISCLPDFLHVYLQLCALIQTAHDQGVINLKTLASNEELNELQYREDCARLYDFFVANDAPNNAQPYDVNYSAHDQTLSFYHYSILTTGVNLLLQHEWGQSPQVIAQLLLIEKQWLSAQTVDGRVAKQVVLQCTVLVQLEGITKTDGFGLLYDSTHKSGQGLITATTNVTPESREFLQNLIDCRTLSSQGAYFPATTQALLKVNPVAHDVIPQYWGFEEKRDPYKLQPMQTFDQAPLEVNVVDPVKAKLKHGQDAVKSALKKIRKKVPSNAKALQYIADVSVQDVNVFAQLFAVVQKLKKKLGRDNMFVGAAEPAKLKDTVMSALEQLELRLTKIESEDAQNQVRVNTITNDIIVRRPVVSFRQYDRMQMLRFTAGLTESDANYINSGYQKLSSQNIVTIQCSKRAFLQNQGVSCFTQLRAHLMSSLEESLVADGPNPQSALSYGSLLSAFQLSSKQSTETVGLWKPHVHTIHSDEAQLLYYDSLSIVSDQFCDDLPTLVIVRYDKERLQDDQKISQPGQVQDGEEETFSDRMYFMEPDLQYIDTYLVGRVHSDVERILLSYQEAYEAKAKQKEEQKGEENEANQEGAGDMNMDGKDYRTREDILRFIRGGFNIPDFTDRVNALRPQHVFQVLFQEQTLTEGHTSHYNNVQQKMAEFAANVQDAEIKKSVDLLVAQFAILKQITTRPDPNAMIQYPMMLKRGLSAAEQLALYGNMPDGYEGSSLLSVMSMHQQTLVLSSMRDQNQDLLQCSFVQNNVTAEALEDQAKLTQLLAQCGTALAEFLGNEQTFQNQTDQIALVSYGRLAGFFNTEGTIISSTKIHDFLKIVVKQSAVDGKRFVIRYNSPTQRIAFSDYIDQLTVVSATTMCEINTRTFRANYDDQNGLKPVRIVELKNTVSNPFQQYYSGHYNLNRMIVAHKIDQDKIDMRYEKMYPLLLYSLSYDELTDITFSTSYVFLRTQAFVIPRWAIKQSASYTRRSVAPGASLLRMTRDPVDIIQIRHPTLRMQKQYKEYRDSYFVRDVNVHLIQKADNNVSRTMEESALMLGQTKGQRTSLMFNSKQVSLYCNSVVSQRIQKLLQLSGTNQVGSMSTHSKYVGIPFFTPYTRMGLAMMHAQQFQSTFSALGVQVGGYPPTVYGLKNVVAPYPVLGATASNIFFTTPEKLLSPTQKQQRWVGARVDLLTQFYDTCIPTENDLPSFREYKSRYSFGLAPVWKTIFPLSDDVKQMLKDTSLDFIGRYTGVHRARYFLQGNMFDFRQTFSQTAGHYPDLIASLYAVGDLYKESLQKFVISLKTTFEMYRDNPFMVESFLQVHFQQKRTKNVNQAELILFNEKVNDISQQSFSLTDNDSTQLTPKKPVIMFAHNLHSVFIETLLVKQGCPIDPQEVLKKFVSGRGVAWEALAQQTYSGPVRDAIVAQAAKLVGKQSDSKARYLAFMQDFKAATLLEQIGTMTLWDMTQFKFLSDPQLLFETFIETSQLPNGQENNRYILEKVVQFKQSRYRQDQALSQKVCPQFPSFFGLNTEGLDNTGSTLIDYANMVMNALTGAIPNRFGTADAYSHCREGYIQLYQDVNEQVFVLVETFTLIFSGYLRSQIKGSRDQEVYNILRMFQMYALELHVHFQTFMRLSSVAATNIKFNNVSEATKPVVLVALFTAEETQILRETQVSVSVRLYTMANVKIAPPRGGVNDAKLAADNEVKMKEILFNEAPQEAIRTQKLIKLADAVKIKQVYAKSLMIPSKELRMFLKLVASVKTGLVLSVKHFEFKDGEFGVVTLTPIPNVTQAYNLDADNRGIKEIEKQIMQAEAAYRASNERIDQWQLVIWYRIHRELSAIASQEAVDKRDQYVKTIDPMFLQRSIVLPEQNMLAYTYVSQVNLAVEADVIL